MTSVEVEEPAQTPETPEEVPAPSPPVEEPDTSPPEEQTEEQSASEELKIVAQEVIAGHWGRGRKCKERLEEAGYDVELVNAEMRKIFNQ